MSDTALKNAEIRLRDARAKIIKAEQDLRHAQEELARAEAFIRAWHDFADMPLPELEKIVEKESVATQARPKVLNPRKEDVADVARSIIGEYGRPVSRAELRAALTDRGINIRGSDPDMVLSTMLWRMQKKVVRLKNHGYWLADIPYPEADYNPGITQMLEAQEKDLL